VEVTWTIAELAERAAEALEAFPQRASGRVRDVPNERLIRWYVTVGLVDPPLSRRGRVARYGERHLLQLVAVKRRQAQGRSLAEIQQELAGATDEALAAAAALPVGPAPEGPRPGAVAAPKPAGRFWARPPSPEAPSPEAPSPEAPSPAEPAPGGRPGSGSGLVRGIRLAPGVVLLLEAAGHEPGPDEMTTIVNAARPLLRALADRGLARPPEEEPE
jgi:DNA-binding transcriptional MerR regulator